MVKFKHTCRVDTRYCLLKAATKLFSSWGLAKTSTRDLARESNTNVALISYHFGGKEGLYKEVLREFALEVQSSTREIVYKFENQEMNRELFIDHVTAVIDNMLSMRKKYPEVCLILSREKVEGMKLSKEIYEEIFYPLIQKFCELIVKAQEKDIVKKEIDPMVFFIFLTEGLWGFFEIAECDLPLKKHQEKYVQNFDLLKKQLLTIYIHGVLV